jgi:hypothetical protein
MVTRGCPSFKGYTVYICHGGRHGKQLPTEQREGVKQPSVKTRLIDAEVWSRICGLINDEGALTRHLVRLDGEDGTTANVNAIDARPFLAWLNSHPYAQTRQRASSKGRPG